ELRDRPARGGLRRGPTGRAGAGAGAGGNVREVARHAGAPHREHQRGRRLATAGADDEGDGHGRADGVGAGRARRNHALGEPGRRVRTGELTCPRIRASPTTAPATAKSCRATAARPANRARRSSPTRTPAASTGNRSRTGPTTGTAEPGPGAGPRLRRGGRDGWRAWPR